MNKWERTRETDVEALRAEFSKLKEEVAVLKESLDKSKLVLKCKKLSPDAVIPTRGTEGAAGLDMYAVEDVLIHPGTVGEIHTMIAMEMPPEYFGLLLTRSNMGKRMVRLSAGANAAPDNDYRGEMIVYLTNDGIYPWQIKKGDRVAQVVVLEYLACDAVEAQELSKTKRGTGGFGSTGR